MAASAGWGCAQAHADTRSNVTHAAAAAALPVEQEPPAPETKTAWTAATTLDNPPVDLPKGVAGVVAHLPAGFDPTEPIHLVIFLHGAYQCVTQIALSGNVVCKPGTRPRAGQGIIWRHDDAGTNTVFVAPQFLLWGGGTPGKMAERGYFRSFVEELLRDTLAPGLRGPRTLDDLADITLVAHSAGHMPLAAILDRQDLDDKIKNVVLLDALYDGRYGPYTRWLERDIASGDRKFVAIYGDWGRNPATGRAIAARMEGRAKGSTIVDPAGSIQDAIRSHQVTVAIWNLKHAKMLGLTLSKVLAGLGLPERQLYPPRIPRGDPPAPIALDLGTRISGALTKGDASLENGAFFDDYAIDLDAGQALDIDVRGGASSKADPGSKLDVFLEVLQDGRSLAQDDDGSGEFDSSLHWTAPEKGRYVVRVSTSGSGQKRGRYTLLAQ